MTEISNEARDAAQKEVAHRGTIKIFFDWKPPGHFVQLAINTAIEASAKREAELRDVAKELAGALEFVAVYQRENCDGQIGWRSIHAQEAIAGDVKVKHILQAEKALARYQKVANEKVSHTAGRKPETEGMK